MRISYRLLLVSAICSLTMSHANAAMVGWTDWTNFDATTATGQIAVNSDSVAVTTTSTADFYGVQTGTGTNYFSPDTPYLSTDVENAPPAAEQIQLNAGGRVTIEFSQPVEDPLLALVSWNGNTVEFGTAIEFLEHQRSVLDEHRIRRRGRCRNLDDLATQRAQRHLVSLVLIASAFQVDCLAWQVRQLAPGHVRADGSRDCQAHT